MYYSLILTFIFALVKLALSYGIVNWIQNTLLIQEYSAMGLSTNIIYIIRLIFVVVVYFWISKIFTWLFGNAFEKRSLRSLEKYVQNITKPNNAERSKQGEYMKIIEKKDTQNTIKIIAAVCFGITAIVPFFILRYLIEYYPPLYVLLFIGFFLIVLGITLFTLMRKKNIIQKYFILSKEEKIIIKSADFQEFLHKYIFLQKYKQLEDVEANPLGQGILGFIISFMICTIILLVIILIGGSTTIAITTFMLMLAILYIRNTYFAMQKIGLKESDMYKKFFPNGTETMQNIPAEELIEKEGKREKSKITI